MKTEAESGRPMTFRVGGWTYRVKVADEPMVDDVGLPSPSLHCWSEFTIWLCPTMPLEQRTEALMYELGNAWMHHMPLPERREERTAWLATFICDVWQQFSEQGGRTTFMQLQAETAPPIPSN